jgi:hypothetical protein
MTDGISREAAILYAIICNAIVCMVMFYFSKRRNKSDE